MKRPKVSDCRLLKKTGAMLRRRAYSSARAVGDAEVLSARSYCKDLLRQYDYSSHLLNAFIPPAGRDTHLAIRAFNVDIARVADSVSNAMAGRFRMQYWKEAVGKTFAGAPPSEPIAKLLASVLQRGHRLTKPFFTRIIQERVCSFAW